MQEQTTVFECTWCGNEVDWEGPYTTSDHSGIESGEQICYDCFTDRFEFQCCWCENYCDKKNQHKMLVVAAAERGLNGDVQPGVYRITRFPYYADGIIEGYLFNDTLDRVADVPEVDTGSFSCGHLCDDCQAKVAAASSPC